MHTEIDEKLYDLEPSDPFLPPDADATRALEVVPVHDDVYGKIERDGNPGHGRRPDELRVAEDRGRTVVVAMEEGWPR